MSNVLEHDPEDAQRLRRARMDEIDALDAETRDLVNQFGWTVVSGLRSRGITAPRRIIHLAMTAMGGLAAYGPGAHGERLRGGPSR